MPYELANAPAIRSRAERLTRANDHPRQYIDLFPSPAARTGSRFDDTVALPVDTPRCLAEVISTVARRLQALPEPHDLGHRSIAYRAQLERVRREALGAWDRLVAGTYGTCTKCAAPISLAILSQKPWTPLCIYCELDI